jgi:hypothetical protein
VPGRHAGAAKYDEHVVLRPDHAPGESGLRVHYADDGSVAGHRAHAQEPAG